MLFIEKLFYLDQVVKDQQAAISILNDVYEPHKSLAEENLNAQEIVCRLQEIEKVIEDTRYHLNSAIRTLDTLIADIAGNRAEIKTIKA